MSRRTNFIPIIGWYLSLLILTGCSSSGNNVTVSGGSSTNASSNQKIVFAGASSIARGNRSSYFGFPIENRGVRGIEISVLVNTITGHVASLPDNIFIPSSR